MEANIQATDKLLMMYRNYTAIRSQLSAAESQLVKAKIRQADTLRLAAQHASLKQKLQQLSDTMTFDNPIVWMMYKFIAYKNEPMPILTMGDFRMHCSQQGYICTKRFHFTNMSLVTRGHAPLSDEVSYSDELLLSSVFNNKILVHLAGDQSFQKVWHSFEYNTKNGEVAKWENYEQ